jgi:Na+-translocating ferredoxin:NAD+ oxidoreductase subunit C
MPRHAGVLVLDAAAALAVGRCFLFDQPMTGVPFGIYDRQRGRAVLMNVPIGTALADVLSAAEVKAASCDLRAGHFLRELPAATDAIVAGAELTVSAAEAHEPPEPAACLRCGFCVDACPARIHPAGLLEAAQQQDPEMAARFGINSCVDCGICSYVCPSRLPLLSSIRLLRQE